jgi:hypothetical protein
MAREGEGDKLEHIAEEEKLPAATVRQRVSRMRRWMKDRWLKELAAVAAFSILAFVVWKYVLDKPKEIAKPVPTTEPTGEPPTIQDQAKEIRRLALQDCERGEAQKCLDGLDRAKNLDPDGDKAPEIGAARKKAQELLAPPPPQSTSSIIPNDTATPAPTQSVLPDLNKKEWAPPTTTGTPKVKAPPPTTKPTAKSEFEIDSKSSEPARDSSTSSVLTPSQSSTGAPPPQSTSFPTKKSSGTKGGTGTSFKK